MKAKLLLFFFCLSVLSGMGQGTTKQNKCKTCGKVISQCRHKGKHPKPTPKQNSKPRGTASNQNLTIRVGDVNFVMVKVSGGTFTMGATSEMTEPLDDEKPTHQVTLSSYYIGETEVTQALWKAVMGWNPSEFKGDNLPVESVTWYNCQAFISKLNALTGKRFRLPTEAEWEFAARGGNQSRHTKYSGSRRLNDVAWYNGNSGITTHPVKTKQPNELGIYDMTGNVWEWCQDWYGSYSSDAQTNPTGASSGSDRVGRGSSWNGSPSSCRSSFRNCCPPELSHNGLGLRLVLSPTPHVTASYQNEVLRVGNVSYRMISVSGGTFTMGATSEMENPSYDEKPTHQVTLSSYYIGETEVTQALWKAVMGSNPSARTGDDLPVEEVSWNDCQTFISTLNALTGKNFRLPTEAEWEFAARGGNQSRHTQYSGSSRIGDVAWFGFNNGNKTHPVKTKQPNELGIYDMAGNVWEWCQDLYGSYSSHAQTNPTGASSGSKRVRRGGCWVSEPNYCHSSCRYGDAPENSHDGLGLRLVLSQ